MKLNRIHYFFFNLLILLLTWTNTSSAQESKLSSKLDALTDREFFHKTFVSIDIFDLTEQSSIYSKNENMLISPASNMKILTSAAGLLFLDNFYFTTSFYFNGTILDSTLYGDLIVVGGCDPEFNIADLDSALSTLRTLGINKITGNILGDVSMTDSLYWGEGWMWDDDPGHFTPYLTPLIINDAGVQIVFEPGKINKHVLADIFPKSNYYTFENTSVTVDEDTSDLTITRDWINRKNNVSVSGFYSSEEKKDTAEINLYRPDLYFLTLAKEHLDSLNISFSGVIDTAKVDSSAVIFFENKRSFLDILDNLNKESDNLNAEMTLKALASVIGERSSADGLLLIDSLIILSGHDPEEFRLADGSGLSRYNLISTKLIVDVFEFLFLEHPKKFQRLINSFPIAGVDGTLKSRMTSGVGYKNVQAKTGTSSGISALSGLLTTRNNHIVAFSIMMQNFVDNVKEARHFQNKICELIIKYY